MWKSNFSSNFHFAQNISPRFANEQVASREPISCETTAVAQTGAYRHYHRRGLSRPCLPAANRCSPGPLGHRWTARQRPYDTEGWRDGSIHQCVLSVCSSVPANCIPCLHHRSFAIIVRDNECAGPSCCRARTDHTLSWSVAMLLALALVALDISADWLDMFKMEFLYSETCYLLLVLRLIT